VPNDLKILHQKGALTMPQTFKRHFLREKEAAKLLLNFSQKLKANPKQLFGTKTRVESVEKQAIKIFLVNGEPLLASYKDMFLPTLIFNKALNRLPKIVVDMGAVPHICNGADIMAPGVVQINGKFQADDFLLIIDERHGKPRAIVKALISSEEMKTLKQGKMIRNLHYVGDKLWRLLKQL
jgi:PUA domain protein